MLGAGIEFRIIGHRSGAGRVRGEDRNIFRNHELIAVAAE